MKFESITCFENLDKVVGYFSLKNPAFGLDDIITGLNVGYNTTELDEIANQKRKMWFDNLGLDINQAAWGIQVHGKNVQVVESPGIFEGTDGLITNKSGISLNIFVADCAALLFADEKNGVIGACHAGWRGAVSGIIPNTINKMIAADALQSDIRVFVSPCISEKHFEVGPEVAEKFPESCIETGYSKPHVNLKKFIKNQLTENGILESDIIMSDACTFGNSDKFYSYRREGKNAGRMIATIMLRK